MVNTSAAYGTAGTWLLDPADFTIGTDILGATLSTNLGLGNVTIHSGDGTVVPNGNGDIFVNQAVTWATTTTLTLNAVRDVIMNSTVTPNTGGNYVVIAGRDFTMNNGSTVTPTGGNFTVSAVRDVNLIAGSTVTSTNGSFSSTAGQDINLNSDITVTDGNITENAGRNININVALPYHITNTRGTITLRSDNDGTGPGVAGGTVNFTVCNNCITSTRTAGGPLIDGITNIYYNPTVYTTLTDYGTSGYVTGTGSGNVHSYAWLFAKGVNKTYDGTTAATVTFAGAPGTSMGAGTATFDTKDAGANKVITLTGYTFAYDASKYALFDGAGAGKTTADITQKALSITASDAAKVYGQSIVLTAWTQVGLVNGETIGSVTESSPGTATDASAAGSPYMITPSSASGGSFSAANYAITYLQGKLVVTGSTAPGDNGGPTSGTGTPGTTAPGGTPSGGGSSSGGSSSGGSSGTTTPGTPGAPGTDAAEMLGPEPSSPLGFEQAEILVVPPRSTLLVADALPAPSEGYLAPSKGYLAPYRQRKQDRN